jgi:hypothetical protein
MQNWKKKSKEKNNSTLFLNEKKQKKLAKNPHGYIDASNLRFYPIGLNFGPQVHNEF